MSDTATAAAPAPIETPAGQPSEVAPTEQPSKTPKEVAREQFKRETAELVARDRAERDGKGKQPATLKTDGAEPEAAPTRTLRLKVDGEELELPEAEVIKRAQISSAAQKRMQQAAETQKQAQQFIELLKTNPRAVLQHPGLGVDIKQLAEQVIWEQLQQSTKSPEEVERENERRELEELRAEKARRDAEAKTAEREELKERYRQDWSKKFGDVLEGSGLPKTDWTLTRMAGYMRQALARGHKHVQPADVVDFVREDWQAAQRQMFGHLDGDNLLQMLGDDVAEKVRKSQLRKFQDESSKPTPAAPKTQPAVKYSTVEELVAAQRRGK